MKKLIAFFMCVTMVIGTASCGKSDKKELESVVRISPDMMISAETASSIVGITMEATENGVVNEGKMQSITYMPDPIGSADPVVISIEQFSDSLTLAQVWNDYENDRIRRPDAFLLEGIGTDCYIAYPYINVYDRGCYIRICAGSGSGEEQKNMLINLASQAVTVVEQSISEAAVNAASSDVIK